MPHREMTGHVASPPGCSCCFHSQPWSGYISKCIAKLFRLATGNGIGLPTLPLFSSFDILIALFVVSALIGFIWFVGVFFFSLLIGQSAASYMRFMPKGFISRPCGAAYVFCASHSGREPCGGRGFEYDRAGAWYLAVSPK